MPRAHRQRASSRSRFRFAQGGQAAGGEPLRFRVVSKPGADRDPVHRRRQRDGARASGIVGVEAGRTREPLECLTPVEPAVHPEERVEGFEHLQRRMLVRRENPAATFLTQVARVDSVERVGRRSGLYQRYGSRFTASGRDMASTSFNEIARDVISADIAVFETSDQNSNVMIEMGVALTWGRRVLPINRAQHRDSDPRSAARAHGSSSRSRRPRGLRAPRVRMPLHKWSRELLRRGARLMFARCSHGRGRYSSPNARVRALPRAPCVRAETVAATLRRRTTLRREKESLGEGG